MAAIIEDVGFMEITVKTNGPDGPISSDVRFDIDIASERLTLAIGEANGDESLVPEILRATLTSIGFPDGLSFNAMNTIARMIWDASTAIAKKNLPTQQLDDVPESPGTTK